MAERWPALMTRETAADYCDMSAEQFDRQCPVAPVDQGWRGLRWKRSKLDAWIDGLPEKPRSGKIGIDSPLAAAANAAPATTAEERRREALARW